MPSPCRYIQPRTVCAWTLPALAAAVSGARAAAYWRALYAFRPSSRSPASAGKARKASNEAAASRIRDRWRPGPSPSTLKTPRISTRFAVLRTPDVVGRYRVYSPLTQQSAVINLAGNAPHTQKRRVHPPRIARGHGDHRAARFVRRSALLLAGRQVGDQGHARTDGRLGEGAGPVPPGYRPLPSDGAWARGTGEPAAERAEVGRALS